MSSLTTHHARLITALEGVFSIKILFCSSEVAPFSKTGGLADVAGSLPLAMGKRGMEVLVTMPKYRGIDFTEKRIAEKVTVRAIEHEAFYNRHSLYGSEQGGYADNLERFTHFCYASLNAAKEAGFKPDVAHVHDWHAALIPVLLKTKYSEDPFFTGTRSLLTIHNLAYQGHFDLSQYEKLGLGRELLGVDGFEFYGKINVLKAGLLYSDAINTVSPSYAREICRSDYGYGLDGVLRQRKKVLSGILNGIDEELWNPDTDTRIAATYSAERTEGKALCKAALQAKCGFEQDPDIPLFAVVTRLAEQKGLDLLASAADQMLSKRLQFVLLGDGEERYRWMFQRLGDRYPKKARIYLGFDGQEARSVYSAADFFLMPSLFEPCGLGQIIGMRYGAVPVVRKTGGLQDTVTDCNEKPRSGTGIVFNDADSSALLWGIEQALVLFGDRKRYRAVQKTGMKKDHSWDQSAAEYEALYRLLGGSDQKRKTK